MGHTQSTLTTDIHTIHAFSEAVAENEDKSISALAPLLIQVAAESNFDPRAVFTSLSAIASMAIDRAVESDSHSIKEQDRTAVQLALSATIAKLTQ